MYSSFNSTISTSLWAATNITGFSETLSGKFRDFSQKILKFSEKFLKFNRKILEFRENRFLFYFV